MRKAIVLLLVISAFTASYAQNTKIRRVGYSGPQVSGVDFPNVGAAVQAAATGDTIQLYQNASVGSSWVDKRLVFIGFGWGLESNPGLQAVPATPNGVSLYFNAGSENSVVQGVYFSEARIGANNITISRSVGVVYLGFSPNGNIPISDVAIISSYLQIDGSRGAVSNALISNSIVTQMQAPNVAGLFTNNIVTTCGGSFGSFVVKNNIFTNSCCFTGNSAVFQNNIFRLTSSACSLTGSGNQFNVDMNNVFVNWNNGSFGSESNLALKAGSPAIGFGIDGSGNPTDAGIYGGEAGLVYKPSGIPAIPAIYQLSAPQLNASTNPYTITVSVRSNN